MEKVVLIVAVSGNLTALLAFIYSILKSNNNKEVTSRVLMAIDKLNLTLSTIKETFIISQEKENNHRDQTQRSHDILRKLELEMKDISNMSESSLKEVQRLHTHLDEVKQELKGF